MRKSITGVLAIAGVAAAGMLTATSASADLVTRCSGTAGDVTVPGDLVVPAGQTCDLTGTTVDGDVRVRAGADLIGEDVTVTGDIVGAADAYLDLYRSQAADPDVAIGWTMETDEHIVAPAYEGVRRLTHASPVPTA